ncbi:MAG TPA: hypothetical protein VF912_15210 [Anaeromyxobacter sp.]
MRRLHGALIAFVLAVLAGPAAAAEITRVATSGEPGNPFDIDISIRWDRFNERGTITRERAGGVTTAGTIVEGDELRYDRTRNAIVPRVAVGLWNDLEFHFELPYVLGDDRTWRYGLVYGQASGPNPTDPRSIDGNGIDAQGDPCIPAPCPLFPVAPKTTVYHGGRAGDFKAGLAWGIFNDQKDDTKPFWLVGLDVTFPTATLYDPAKDRGTTWSSPYDVPAKPGPFGERIWKWDLYTTMSRRMGYVDPYVKAHVTTAFKSATTYSNCKNAKELTTAMPVQQMNDAAVANCASWGSEAGAKLPWVVGLTFGTEVVPYEDAVESQRVSLDFRVHADYTSSQRFYNELTDATGKLLQTEGYLEMGALVGLYLRASKFVSLQTTASLSTRTAHYLTGESLGKSGSTPALDPATGRPLELAAMNPNFDWRYDAPGRRFRISEVSVFELAFAGVLQF